jgi:hypothetical protein
MSRLIEYYIVYASGFAAPALASVLRPSGSSERAGESANQSENHENRSRNDDRKKHLLGKRRKKLNAKEANQGLNHGVNQGVEGELDQIGENGDDIRLSNLPQPKKQKVPEKGGTQGEHSD